MATVLTTEHAYKDALQRLSAIMHFPLQAPEGEEAATLIDRIEAYEKPFVPGLPDPIEMIQYAMESKGWTVDELRPIMAPNRASEIFNRKRPLNLRMIRWFHQELGISMECLTKEYSLRRNI
jgi:HTH-type transcriptional regulator/antitoxin HigA